jgi:hypothetical protein
MKKLLLRILFLCIWINGLSALSLAREYFVVYNLSDNVIIINFESPVQPTDVGSWQYYILEIAGVPVIINDPLFGHAKIAPDKKVDCVYYLPSGTLIDIFENDYYEKLDAIPILDKLNTIFKSFTITDLEGNILVALADIKEEDIIREQMPNSRSINYIFVLN